MERWPWSHTAMDTSGFSHIHRIYKMMESKGGCMTELFHDLLQPTPELLSETSRSQFQKIKLRNSMSGKKDNAHSKIVWGDTKKKTQGKHWRDPLEFTRQRSQSRNSQSNKYTEPRRWKWKPWDWFISTSPEAPTYRHFWMQATGLSRPVNGQPVHHLGDEHPH